MLSLALRTGAQVGPEPSGGGVPKARSAPIWGYADLHVHQFSNLGFGGLMFWGAPFGNIEQALRWCSDAHGPGGTLDLIGNTMSMMASPRSDTKAAAVAGGVLGSVGGVVGAITGAAVGAAASGHLVGGYPQFDGWPRWDSFTHQQVYADWLKRAHDGGLQLMVMYAVNNAALCSVTRHPGRSCDDMEAVDREIQSAKDMEAWVDAQAGGAGKGWYRLVYSPQQARDAIASGQLAVVLGTEIPTLFGCSATNRDCNYDYVRDQLKRYRDAGIRDILPIHNADNAFGGSAVYNDLFNFNNKKIAGDYFSVRDCSAENVEFRFGLGAAAANVEALMKEPYRPPPYPNSGHCNQLGLTPLGKWFIAELMSRHMIIDVDHMSWLSLADALKITGDADYPVVNSHTGMLDISLGQKRSEGQKTRAQLQAVYDHGGLVGPILFEGGRKETLNRYSPIPHDCGNSSQSFAQAYLYVVQQFPGRPVALGSDFNGLAGEPSPRFGPDACTRGDQGPRAQLGGRIAYPFQAYGIAGRTLDKSTSGKRTFDYNVDGLAHIGLLPDMIEDIRVQLRAVGSSEQLLDPLFHSAEAYIRMWEKAEGKTIAAPTIPRPPVLALDVEQSDGTAKITARDGATGEVRNGTVVILNETKSGVQSSGPTGALLHFKPCREFDTQTKRWSPGACTVRVTVPGYPVAVTKVGDA